MISFLKAFFRSKTDKSEKKESCCGGKCAGRESSGLVDLGLSEADKEALKKVPDSVIVGKILSISEHPDPKITKVRVTKCDLGNGKIEQILCGGVNIAEGQIVPIATLGTDLGEGFIIGERVIRGEVSRGMICARQELGLTEVEAEKNGIWPLPESLESKLGTPVNRLV